MMKIYVFSALCCLFMLSACNDAVVKKEKKCDREEMGLLGKVQFLITNDERGNIRYTFNEAGYLISEYYTPDEMDAEDVLKTEYTYGTDGKLASISRYSQMDGSLETKEIFNADGNMTALETYSNNYGSGKKRPEVHHIKHLEYNEEGFLVKSYLNEDDGKNYSEYECDAAGNVLKRTDYFNGTISLIARNGYKYDERGNIIVEDQYKAEIPGNETPSTGKVVEKKEFKYDDADAMLEQIQSSYTEDGREHYLKHERFFKYTLDEHHNPVSVASSTCTYPEPQMDAKKRCDDNGVQTYTYEYDEQGNWTSCKSEQKGMTHYKSRTILYFE